MVLCLPINVPEHLLTDPFRFNKNANCHDQRYETFFLSQPIIQVSVFLNIYKYIYTDKFFVYIIFNMVKA